MFLFQVLQKKVVESGGAAPQMNRRDERVEQRILNKALRNLNDAGIPAKYRDMLKSYYGSDLNDETLQKIDKFTSWLNENRERLVREFSEGVKEGCIRCIGKAGEQPKNLADQVLFAWLASQYAISTQPGKADKYAFKVHFGKDSKNMPFRYDPEEVKGIPTINIALTLTNKGLTASLIAAFNGTVHEAGHAIHDIYPENKKDNAMGTEFSAYLAQSNLGFPIKKSDAEDAFWTTTRHNVSVYDAAKPNSSREYVEFILGPYVEAFLKGNGQKTGIGDFHYPVGQNAPFEAINRIPREIYGVEMHGRQNKENMRAYGKKQRDALFDAVNLLNAKDEDLPGDKLERKGKILKILMEAYGTDDPEKARTAYLSTQKNGISINPFSIEIYVSDNLGVHEEPGASMLAGALKNAIDEIKAKYYPDLQILYDRPALGENGQGEPQKKNQAYFRDFFENVIREMNNNKEGKSEKIREIFEKYLGVPSSKGMMPGYADAHGNGSEFFRNVS